MKDAANKRVDDKQRQDKEDREHLRKIKRDLEEERQKKAQSKTRERETALKVIKDNEINKQRRMRDEELQKQLDEKMIQATMEEAERKEIKRLEEIAARDAKMKKILDTMGD